MPNNRVIYWGVVVLVATALLWIGAELTKRIVWILPYTAGVAILLIVGGFIHEWWRTGRPTPPSASVSPPPAKLDAPPSGPPNS